MINKEESKTIIEFVAVADQLVAEQRDEIALLEQKNKISENLIKNLEAQNEALKEEIKYLEKNNHTKSRIFFTEDHLN
tara:strand:- start:2557 stop:2790 length:234 start_codon:yes stop_codon:yes gene_type:complete